MGSFDIARSVFSRVVPSARVLHRALAALRSPLFEPLGDALLRDSSKKTLFLVALATP